MDQHKIFWHSKQLLELVITPVLVASLKLVSMVLRMLEIRAEKKILIKEASSK